MPSFHPATTSLLALAVLAVCPALHAQHAPPRQDFAAAGTPLVAQPADPEVTAALRQVSPDAIRSNITRLVAFHNRSTLSSTETDLPPATGVLAAADYIQAQFEQISAACGGCLEVKVDAFIEPPATGPRARILKPTPLRNVYAILRGTDPVASKRMYLVTGHYDTRNSDNFNTHDEAPGANDDSSGTAVSMESARILSKFKFPATLVFVAVAGEEQGLNGSHHLAQLAKDQGWQLEGVLNNDIVGGDTTPGDTLQDKSRVRVFSQGLLPTTLDQAKQMLSLGLDNDTPSRELARSVLDAARTYFPASPRPTLKPVMELRLDRFLRGGDHKSFSDDGFAAVRFTEWRENFNHQHQNVRSEGGVEYGDLLKFDDFTYISNVARLNMATLATLAQSPGEPHNVRVVTANLDNNSTLKWDPPTAFHGRVGYQIVWRETAASDWQFSTNAAAFPATGKDASATAATLPVSKDNVFFGVRACDGAGHCSPAVTPLPERP